MVRGYFKKYIHFSLISNCIVFNTLAGSGKQDGKGKKCSGSGKDKNKSNTTGEGENELSSEKLAKKQKEEEERKQKEKKAKEEAEKLAKDKAALDTKKQELIDVIDALVPRITKLNTSGYNDLKINEIITKDQINLANAKTIADLEDKINKLNDKIDKNEKTLAKYEELKKKKDDEFYPRFNGLQEKMDIINNLNGCTIKVDSTIITKKMIDDSKYEDIPNITQKLKNLETEINTKFEEIKNDLKTKNTEIKTKKENDKCPVRDLININYTNENIDGCNFDKLTEIYKDIKFYYDISKAQPDGIKKHFSDRFKEIESVFDFFIIKEPSRKADLESYKKNIFAIKKVNSINTNVLVFNNATNGLKNIEIILDKLINEYNKNYKKRLEDSITLNKKLTIELKYVEKIPTLSGGDTEETYYDHKIEKIFSVNNTEINEEIITIDYNKSLEQLNSIETKIKNLEDNVEKNKKEFITKITNTFNFLKTTYEHLCDLSAYRIDNTDVDSYKKSTNTLFEKIKTELKKALLKAENISKNIALEPELEEFFEKYNVYSAKDKVGQIPTEYLAYEIYFDSNNQNSENIKTNVKNLMDSLKNCDQDNLKKKILAKIKNLVHTYRKDISVDYILHNIVISKIQDEKTKDFYFYKDERSKVYETDEFGLTSEIFNVPAYKIIFPKEIIVDILDFDKMKKIIENFTLLFNHNVELFTEIKKYFSNCKIKDFLGDVNFDDFFDEKQDNINIFEDLRKIKIDDYFENYLSIDKYISNYPKNNHKKLVEFENLLKKLIEYFSIKYFVKDNKFKFFKDKSLKDKINIEIENVLFNPDILKVYLFQCFIDNKKDNRVHTSNFYNRSVSKYTEYMDKLLIKYIIENSNEERYLDDLYYYYCILLNIKKTYRTITNYKLKYKNGNIINFDNCYNYLSNLESSTIKYGFLYNKLPDYFYFDKENKKTELKDPMNKEEKFFFKPSH